MAPNDRLADAVSTAGNVLTQQQFDYVAQVVAAMNRVAKMRQIFAESAAESVIACVEAAVKAQQQITEMTTDAAPRRIRLPCCRFHTERFRPAFIMEWSARHATFKPHRP